MKYLRIACILINPRYWWWAWRGSTSKITTDDTGRVTRIECDGKVIFERPEHGSPR